jgi:hypothetical protein
MRSDTVAEISRMFTAGAHRTKFTEVQRREPRTDPDTGVDFRYWHKADKPTASEFIRFWGYSGHRD